MCLEVSNPQVNERELSFSWREEISEGERKGNGQVRESLSNLAQEFIGFIGRYQGHFINKTRSVYKQSRHYLI